MNWSGAINLHNVGPGPIFIYLEKSFFWHFYCLLVTKRGVGFVWPDRTKNFSFCLIETRLIPFALRFWSEGIASWENFLMNIPEWAKTCPGGGPRTKPREKGEQNLKIKQNGHHDSQRSLSGRAWNSRNIIYSKSWISDHDSSRRYLTISPLPGPKDDIQLSKVNKN